MRIQAYIELGWSPEFAIASDGERRIQQVVGWIGGFGTAPATGLYIGSTGFVTNITDGVDIRGAAGGGGAAISAGANSQNAGTIVFANSNNITFGLSNDGNLTASFSQSNQNISLFALGNTTQNNSTVLNASKLSFNAIGNITIGFSNGSIQVSQSGGAADGGNILAAGTRTAGSNSTVLFDNANGITFGLDTVNGSVMTGSHNGITSQTNQDVSLYALGNTTQNSSTVLNASKLSFNGLGEVTLGFSNGSIQISSPLQTVDTGKAGTGFTSAGNNIGLSGTLNTGGLSLSATVAAQSLQTQSRFNLTLAGNSTSAGGGYIQVSSGVMTLAGGNNITLSQDGNAVTISGANAGGTQTAISGIVASDATYTSGSVTFRDGNGITWASTTGQQISITHDLQYTSKMSDYQSTGAYLTTAAQSTQTFLASLGGNSGTTNSSRIGNGGFVFAGGNGVTINQSNNSVSWSVATDYQSTGAYLTTAALSTQTLMISLGGNTATTNSSRISNGGYVLAGGNGVTIQQSNNTVSVSVATNYQSQGAYLTTAALSTQTLAFTLSGNVATTNSSQILNGGYALAGGNGVTIQQSNNTVSVSVATNYQSQGAYLTTAALSQDSSKYAGTGVTTGGGAGFSATLNTAGLSVSIPSWLTTADLSANSSNYLRNWKLTGNTAGTTSSAQGTDLWFSGGNGITVSGNNNSIVFSVGNYITTARASTDAIGLNTAQSNVTWTVNSSGLSLDARGYAGTGTTFNGANISGSITQNSLGVQLSMSVAAPGAAAENNWHNLLGANTAGNTTASGSTIGLSGINLTLSGTNNSVINISAPATSSLSAVGALTISTNGSTISLSAGNVFNSTVFGLQFPYAGASTSLGHNSLYFFPEVIDQYVQGSIIKIPVMITLSSSATNQAWTRGHTASIGVYTRQTGTNSTNLTRIYSTSYTAAAVMSSNAQMSISVITAVGNSTSYSTVAANSAGLNLSLSVHGPREFIMPWNTTLAPGEYWICYAQSSSSAGGAGNVFNVSHLIGSSQTQNRMGVSTAASLDGIQRNIGLGTYSATSGGFPPSVSLTEIQGGATWPIIYFLQGTV